MYKIKVLHNYIYKLVVELGYQYPEARFRVRGDTLSTHDPKVVEISKYVFQFQPELLVIEQIVPNPQILVREGKEVEGFNQQSALAR